MGNYPQGREWLSVKILHLFIQKRNWFFFSLFERTENHEGKPICAISSRKREKLQKKRTCSMALQSSDICWERVCRHFKSQHPTYGNLSVQMSIYNAQKKRKYRKRKADKKWCIHFYNILVFFLHLKIFFYFQASWMLIFLNQKFFLQR